MLTVKVLPGTPKGCVTAPPSKSYAHRAIIAAALADGESRIENVGLGDDVLATLAAVRALGAGVKFSGGAAYIRGGLSCKNPCIYCQDSGSTIRFAAPLLAMCGGGTLRGSAALMSRPMQIYERLFAEMGSSFTRAADGFSVGGPLRGGTYQLPGNVSSQFVSGLLFALPLAKEDSTLHVLPPFESAGYVAMTVEILNRYGITVARRGEFEFFIPGGQTYTPADYTVEGDWSSAAFFAVLGALKGSVTCTGLNPASLQADRCILDAVQAFGAEVHRLPDGFTVSAGPLLGHKIDISGCPDLGPVLTCLGALSRGCTTITGADRLIYKESNRLEAMKQELQKIGCNVNYRGGTVEISGGYTSQTQVIESHGDHRVVMSMALTGAVLQSGIAILNPDVCDKSYPEFFEDLQKVGLRVRMRPAGDDLKHCRSQK